MNESMRWSASRVSPPPDQAALDCTAGRRGFALVELLIVMAVLGILANIAVPVILGAREKAAASRILADVDLIHDAVLAYRLEHGHYPDTAGWGVVPAGLAPYLPSSFSFVNGDVRYRYQLQRTAKRVGIDGGGRNSPGREVVARAAAMFIGQKAITARRVWFWLPSPGGRVG
jgi:prepilin-type N-terminal cleavage/methylation domain-containing protein